MELNQLKTILGEHNIEHNVIQSIIAKAAAVTIIPTDFWIPFKMNPFSSRSRLSTMRHSPPLSFRCLMRKSPMNNPCLSSLPPTDKIGDYDDLGELGAGGMGSVRLVKDRKTQPPLGDEDHSPQIALSPFSLRPLCGRSPDLRSASASQYCTHT